MPPVAHDGPERRLVRRQDAAEQPDCESGKKPAHTGQHGLLVNAPRPLLFRRESHGGRVHEKRLAEAPPSPLPAGRRLGPALGCLAFTLPHVDSLMPPKKPRGQERTREQHLANQALDQRRWRLEHVNSRVKRCRILKARLRLWKKGICDLVMERCWALHNFRVRLTPWQPMI